MHEIVVCMGSSCFSRGNAKSAEIVQKFIQENNLNTDVTVRGCLCESECKNGPNIRIDGKLFSDINPDSLPLLLAHELGIEK
ncbi:MAG: (2Fe-2S) ferredoxin domain-containing protein [Treponemataceae bacterium]|nr:(2Fe-2S) ferredoxin domain-containing protein [Treponemataceae bacterium]